VITIRRSEDRGRTQLPWLDGRHTFSFGGYYDPRHQGFRALRVINDDVIAPGGGFDTHPHNDMEIVTVVLSGALRHRDSMGNGSIIRAGEIQRMTAGSGVRHSEHNPSSGDTTRLLQIWIRPDSEGLEPSYEQNAFDTAARPSKWLLVASRDGRDGSLTVHQDVSLHRASVPAGSTLDVTIGTGRHGWLHVVAGSAELAGETLHAGDSAALSDVTTATLTGIETADLLLFDLE
jgi:redox-sensitive bicupin YhaK (pirin superfamily)